MLFRSVRALSPGALSSHRFTLSSFRDSLEIHPTITDIKNAYDNVEKWAKPEKAPFSLNFAAMRPVVFKEAKGAVLIISPFNYPLWLSLPVIVSNH